MILVEGTAGETTLTGTIYERGEESPVFEGAPDEDAAYVFICDAFYEVASGGVEQSLGDRSVRVAFESPIPRGFDTRDQALDAAKDHVTTQFARIRVPEASVDVTVVPRAQLDHSPHRSRS